MERNQFTFYKSFAYAVARIKDPTQQLQALWGIIWYALRGDEMDLDQAPEVVAATMEMVIPTLKAARKKASSGKAGGASDKKTSKTKSASTNGESKNKVKEKEKVKDNEKIKNNIKASATEVATAEQAVSVCEKTDFEAFWELYPLHYDRPAAEQVWARIAPDGETVQRILKNLKEWKRSQRWLNEGGRYIPNASTFLEKDYWQLAPARSVSKELPKGATGEMGETEIENMRRMMET